MENDLMLAVNALLERQSAIELMFVGLVLGVAEQKQCDMPAIVRSLEFMQLFSRTCESTEVAARFEPTLDRLRAARDSEPHHRTPFVALLAKLALEDTHTKEALKTWLSMATPEELDEDLAEMLRHLGLLPAG